jgi:hypothetical protein
MPMARLATPVSLVAAVVRGEGVAIGERCQAKLALAALLRMPLLLMRMIMAMILLRLR